MEVSWEIVLRGLRKGIATTLELAKVIVPTAIVIRLLQAGGLMQWLAEATAPFMGWLGLPGEAAVVLFSGYFINLYAAIGAMLTLSLEMREMTIIAVMLGFCHSIIAETAISKKAGAAVSLVLPLRVGTSLAAGLVLGGLL